MYDTSFIRSDSLVKVVAAELKDYLNAWEMAGNQVTRTDGLTLHQQLAFAWVESQSPNTIKVIGVLGAIDEMLTKGIIDEQRITKIIEWVRNDSSPGTAR